MTDSVLRADEAKYRMMIAGQERFHLIQEAGAWYGNLIIKVELCGEVVEADGSIREITEEEIAKIEKISANHWFGR